MRANTRNLRGTAATIAMSAALLAPGAVCSVAPTSGEFTALAMNVAGLPAILNDNGVPGDKAENAKTIGRKFAQYGYDVIQMQEDFNYHAHIYETDNHPHRTPTSGGVPIGSGLNTVANYPWIDFRRIKWKHCSDITAADCLTPKGFSFMRMELADGVYADFYNVHSDAGQTAIDFWARQSNINQLAEYIGTWSTGNAVLVFGDVNSRYSREGDTAIRDLLSGQNPSGTSMRDPWVDFEYGGVIPSDAPSCGVPAENDACEIVDKMFYRSGSLLTLSAESFTYPSRQFLQDDGVSILSDHNPILVNFTWTAGSNNLRQSAFFGSIDGDGNWFNDAPALTSISKPKASVLTFRGGSRLDSVGVTLTNGASFVHGGDGGNEVSLSLTTSEYWVSAQLCRGQKNDKTRNFYIRATTSAGRTLEAGVATSDCKTLTAPAGWQIVGFLGQSGDEVDQLAFIYAPQ